MDGLTPGETLAVTIAVVAILAAILFLVARLTNFLFEKLRIENPCARCGCAELDHEVEEDKAYCCGRPDCKCRGFIPRSVGEPCEF